MQARLIIANRRHHLRKRQSARKADGERRHQILDVMQTAQLGVSQAQNRLIAINDGAVRKPEISAIGISAESDTARSNFRKYLCSIDDRDILLGLIFENTQLSRPILSDRTITIQVVRSEVEP